MGTAEGSGMEEGNTGVMESNRDPWQRAAHLFDFVSRPSFCSLHFSFTVSFQQSS